MAEAAHQFHRGDQRFSVGKLWASVRNNDIAVIPVDQLTHMLNVWIWMEGTPNKVMSGVVKDEEEHHTRVQRANIDAPIIISELVLDDGGDVYTEIHEQGGRYDILDGIHRLVRHVQLGRSHAKVIFATKAQILASKL